MKYQAVIKKLMDKEKSLSKSKKELVPLVISLTQKSFNELQEDIVLNYKDLDGEYQIKDTEDRTKFILKHVSAALTAELHITDGNR